nr:hypothetical protein BaRGS_003390 [Batillaria attramentaria]
MVVQPASCVTSPSQCEFIAKILVDPSHQTLSDFVVIYLVFKIPDTFAFNLTYSLSLGQVRHCKLRVWQGGNPGQDVRLWDQHLGYVTLPRELRVVLDPPGRQLYHPVDQPLLLDVTCTHFVGDPPGGASQFVFKEPLTSFADEEEVTQKRLKLKAGWMENVPAWVGNLLIFRVILTAESNGSERVGIAECPVNVTKLETVTGMSCSVHGQPFPSRGPSPVTMVTLTTPYPVLECHGGPTRAFNARGRFYRLLVKDPDQQDEDVLISYGFENKQNDVVLPPGGEETDFILQNVEVQITSVTSIVATVKVANTLKVHPLHSGHGRDLLTAASIAANLSHPDTRSDATRGAEAFAVSVFLNQQARNRDARDYMKLRSEVRETILFYLTSLDPNKPSMVEQLTSVLDKVTSVGNEITREAECVKQLTVLDRLLNISMERAKFSVYSMSQNLVELSERSSRLEALFNDVGSHLVELAPGVPSTEQRAGSVWGAVSSETSVNKLHCKCRHLTAVSGTILPHQPLALLDPEAVDIRQYVKDLGEQLLAMNPILTGVVAITWILYGLALFSLFYLDQSDKRKLARDGVVCWSVVKCAVAILEENNSEDNVLYLVGIVTAWSVNAGTTASVYMYIKGEKGKTDVHQLTDSKNRPFKTGAINWFLITQPQSIGHVTSVVIWHDCMGWSPAWYLKEVFVHDIHKSLTWHCIYNDWISASKGLCKEVKAVTPENAYRWRSYQFSFQLTLGLRTTHLWISIFKKPPYEYVTAL